MSATSIDFDKVWRRIRAQAGETFETKSGKPFTYEVEGQVFRPSRTTQNIAKSQFLKAIDLVPIEGPGEIGSLVRGSAYVWAVLHDRRFRRGDW